MQSQSLVRRATSFFAQPATAMRFASLLLAAGLAAFAAAIELPSCEADTEAFCLGEDADMSPEGIGACLKAKGDGLSARCATFLKVEQLCAADLAAGGVCGAAAADGEAMPCLMERTKPEALSEGCRDALPKEELAGLAKFWKDGKRDLVINEIAELNAEDKDTYTRWHKRKHKKGKSEKDKEREYAVKQAKIERVAALLEEGATAALGAMDAPTLEDAKKVVAEQMKTALKEDLTGTLKPFAAKALDGIAKTALKAAKATKAEL